MMDSKVFMITWIIWIPLVSVFGQTVDIKASHDPGKCNKTIHGHFKLVKDRDNNDKLLICSQENGIYMWTKTDGSNPIGEFFNPSYDCSEILNKDPNAEDGFYWVNFNEATPKKVWCDMSTDGGGFMLIAKKDDAETWSVPSDDTTVDPFGREHWSSAFGNAEILDFRVQVSTSQKFQNTKAHWSYRLTKKRPLKRLLVLDEGGCGRRSPGIGHIAYVKDLLTEKIVSTTFRCSIFGDYHRKSFKIGWAMMNDCLMKKCKGFGYHHTHGYQNTDSGAFSYSTSNEASGITKDSTAFIGCDRGKCCACYGPVGGTGSYCDPECRAKNGGNIAKKVFTWMWIRSTLPKRVWNKCMDYQVISKRGKTWFRIVGNAVTPEEGRCPNQRELRLNDGIVVAEDGSTFKNIPPIPGLLSYRRDNKKLYLRANKTWTALNDEKKLAQLDEKFAKQLGDQSTKLNRLSSMVDQLEERLEETRNITIVDLTSSVILGRGQNYLSKLTEWLPFNVSVLCYRASDHGWGSRNFHSRCDNKGPTVTIVRVGNYVFGGYADVSWGGSSRWISSTQSFIFSLKNKDNLAPFKSPVYQNSNYAIYTYSSYGPTFGGGHDLYIANNANSNTNSYTYLGFTYQPPSGYSYGSPNTNALLAGSKYFTVSEIEVYYLR